MRYKYKVSREKRNGCENEGERREGNGKEAKSDCKALEKCDVRSV
jgi:hypothetical protein